MQIIENNFENVTSSLPKLNNKSARQIYEKVLTLLMQGFSILEEKAKDLVHLVYGQLYQNCSTGLSRDLKQIGTNFFSTDASKTK